MNLSEVTDDLIDNLILRLPTDRNTATSAILLTLAWLSKHDCLCVESSQQTIKRIKNGCQRISKGNTQKRIQSWCAKHRVRVISRLATSGPESFDSLIIIPGPDFKGSILDHGFL